MNQKKQFRELRAGLQNLKTLVSRGWSLEGPNLRGLVFGVEHQSSRAPLA
jgi:hypothetical protein